MQFGSTGKGLVAGYLAENEQPDVVVHAFGPNSGHTYIDRSGRKFVHCAVANGVVSPRLKTHLIGPGAVLNLDLLFSELEDVKDLLEGVAVRIHPNAAIVSEAHIRKESGSMTGIGSTKKGTGAAMIEKIERQVPSGITANSQHDLVKRKGDALSIDVRVTSHSDYLAVLEGANHIQIEGAQGYSLGINSGFYPYTTSRECTPAQICSDILVPMPMVSRVVGVMRTFPIRVANRYDEQGNMIGWSGPHYQDQRETSFEQIGQEVEHTTVTKLPRRVFTFSREQTRLAMFQVRPTDVVMGFANYCWSTGHLHRIEGVISEAAEDFGCGSVTMRTWGPTYDEVERIEGGVWQTSADGPC
jgi:adenylosuccinate synthase